MSAAVGARGRLVEVDAADWDGLLRELGLGDAYLTRAYVEASCLLDPGRPVLLHDEDVVFAAIVREIPGEPGRVDVTTPYGYGGPVGPGSHERFWERYGGWCAEQGVVTTFIRFHPLFENWRNAAPGVQLEQVANTATWPLTAGGDLLAGMHSMHRRGARKAERAGLEVSFERPPAGLDDFAALYDESMRRLDADAFYRFGSEYWEALTALGSRLARADARLEGELLSSVLLLANEDAPPWLHYHLGATSSHGFDLGASKLLFLRSAEWGREQGYEELHLGSGLGGEEDSLWQFKQRFSPHPGREFWLGKAVHDEAAYRELTACGAAEGFFPAYRAEA